jgi:hypothetical protein
MSVPAGPFADRVAALTGAASIGWAAIALWPDALAPAWPGASAGLVAIGLATLPGRPLARAAGSFLGLCGLLLACAQIGTLWAVAVLTPS